MKRSLTALLVVLAGCASSVTPEEEPRPAPPRTGDTWRGTPTQIAPTAQQSSNANTQADPKVVAEAQDLYKQGLAAYHVGAYDEAEQLLKRSLTIYPFLAPANLALGKVFLLKGAANHDESLIESARLMFDMAHNIDPSLREPVVLLELFRPNGT